MQIRRLTAAALVAVAISALLSQQAALAADQQTQKAPALTGTLTLDGSGIYLFQLGDTLITAPGARISLINGALPCQVFWQVSSSATIATSTVMVGNIMALTSIALQTGASLNGRALARNGAVTS